VVPYPRTAARARRPEERRRSPRLAATLVLRKPISNFPKPGQIDQRNQRKPYDFLVRIAPFQRVTRPPRPFFFPGPFVVNSWCSMKHALPVGVCPGALGLLSGAVMTMSVIALVSIFRKHLFSKNRTAESAFGTDQPLSRLPMRERGTQQNSPFREAPRNRSRRLAQADTAIRSRATAKSLALI
jgi:hypothetical protein